MRKLKIGILGGTRGLDSLFRVFLNHPLVEVSAICENFAPLGEKIQSETRLLGLATRVFSSFDEMLKCGIDAVIIANYANAHAPYAIKALNHGIHVFSESIPMQTMQEAVELCEAVERSGKIYAYGENYCYLPQILRIRQMFDCGDFGDLMYAEGNFINDCSHKWHLLTRGDRDHWRNHVPSTFYCTHSVGPMLFCTGRRPVSVVGMETQRMPYMAEVGARSGSAAVEIMQLDNGAIAKSMNGNYRRMYSAEYRLIAENGTIETDPYDFGKIHLYTPKATGNEAYEERVYCKPYVFEPFLIHSVKPLTELHDFEIADVYLLNTFIQAILDNQEAKKYMIDVYQALDMAMVGTLAYRSILNKSDSVLVPNMRNINERDNWRHDNRSTDTHVSSGPDLIPSCKSGFVDVPDEVYRLVNKRFADVPISSGGH